MSDEATTAEAAPTKAPKPPKDERNGVTRPRDAKSQTGQVWAIADKLSEQAGAPAARADILKACEAAGINPATAQTQYGRWKKYYGLAGRTAAAPSDAGAQVED